MVTSVLTGVLVLVGAFMTFLIMLQEGKGGGLTALGGTKAAGIEGVTNPIRRATAYMAGLFFLLAIALAMINRPSKSNDFFAAEPAATPAEINTSASTPVLGAGPGGKTTPMEPVKPPAAPLPLPVPTTTPTVSTLPMTTTVSVPATTPAVKVETKPADAPKPVEAAPKPTEPAKPDAPKTPEATK